MYYSGFKAVCLGGIIINVFIKPAIILIIISLLLAVIGLGIEHLWINLLIAKLAKTTMLALYTILMLKP